MDILFYGGVFIYALMVLGMGSIMLSDIKTEKYEDKASDRLLEFAENRRKLNALQIQER